MKKFNVTIIGSGYVGLVTGACLAEIGHSVTCVDNDTRKIQTLQKGHIPIYEPGLKELIAKNKKKKRIVFTNSLQNGIEDADMVFIAVNTPPLPDGEADLSYVEAVTREVAQHMKRYIIIVEKSTVPVQTGEKIKQTIRLYGRKPEDFDVASNPEFLREGTAIKDFLKPDRIVVGVESKRAEEALRALYKPIRAPLIVTDIKSAELIKHSSNSFLAMKISFINAVAQVCERVGADVTCVAKGMGYDKRIGSSFLNAGLGFGGSCFPKDLAAYIKMAERAGYHFDLLKAVQHINEQQRQWVIDHLKKALWNLKGKTIAMWGLAFKPDTDDLRNAPAIDIIRKLQSEGCQVNAYDPVAMEKTKALLPNVRYCKDPYDALSGAEAVVLATEWQVFKDIDLKKVRSLLKTPVFLDARNAFDPVQMASLGFDYTAVGRGSHKKSS
ncbi:MAG TPA: UDP-glucose/GDP-mannose dehydrogenase family protein [Elusimicrobiota bacterium]|nr:UDP-glucose/GDP-mannose dehydrogenase family protein [Elusimicrobiota bacterium]